MNNTVQITWRGITQSPALDADIREKAAKLAQFHDRINRCRVVLEQAEPRTSPYAKPSMPRAGSCRTSSGCSATRPGGKPTGNGRGEAPAYLPPA